MRSPKELAKALRTVIASKQSGNEDILAPLVSEAVLAVMPKNPINFNVDNIRVVKIMGGSLSQSTVVKGMVFAREPNGEIKRIERNANDKAPKVGVFSCPIDISQTETKGTVLLNNAKAMLDFTPGEEKQMDETIKGLADSGMRVVVAGSSVSDLAQHYMNRHKLLVIKVLSKFELRRLCRVVGATPLARLGAPMPDEMGSVDVVETLEIGGDRVTVFRQENNITRTATVVVRGATQNQLDDVERAIDDGVNAIKAITRDAKLVPGAGATEMQLVERITAFGEKTLDLPSYAIKAYAEAFEVIPRTLAESAGLDATEVLAALYTSHHRAFSTFTKKLSTKVNGNPSQKAPPKSQESDESEEEDDDEEEDEEEEDDEDWSTGVDIEDHDGTGTLDAEVAGILDLLVSKKWAVQLATEAARTVLSVDQIIVARQAGGPKPPGPNPNWDED